MLSTEALLLTAEAGTSAAAGFLGFCGLLWRFGSSLPTATLFPPGPRMARGSATGLAVGWGLAGTGIATDDDAGGTSQNATSSELWLEHFAVAGLENFEFAGGGLLVSEV